jgi:hypothetical protein
MPEDKNMSERISRIAMALKSPIARAGLLLLRGELEKAQLQFRRIREDCGKLHAYSRLLSEAGRLIAEGADPFSLPDHGTEMAEAQTALFADVHFLLICLDKVDKLLRTLQKTLPENHALSEVVRRHSKSLEDYSDFRNHLEHIDDRLRKGVTDLGNMGNYLFTFDDKTFDVGLSCEKEVNSIFNETLQALEQPEESHVADS